MALTLTIEENKNYVVSSLYLVLYLLYFKFINILSHVLNICFYIFVY